MADFGRREPHAGSGIDKAEPRSFAEKWRGWVDGLLRPLRRAPNKSNQPPIRRKKR
jgi:hypothetical protein